MTDDKRNEQEGPRKEMEWKPGLCVVRSIARKYSSNWCCLEYDELVSIGYIALDSARKTYNPRHKASFLTYAGHVIRWKMIDAMNQERKNTTTIIDDNTASPEESILDKLAREDYIDKICLKEAIEKLSERQKTIIKKKYYGGKRQCDIAKELNVTSPAVSGSQSTALRILKRSILGKRISLLR